MVKMKDKAKMHPHHRQLVSEMFDDDESNLFKSF